MASPAKDEAEVVLVLDPKVGDIKPVIYEQLANDVFAASVFLRFVNAILVATFFQPDEYFQSLEPAWDIAFGAESGAWITWVSLGGLHCPHNLTVHRSGLISF